MIQQMHATPFVTPCILADAVLFKDMTALDTPVSAFPDHIFHRSRIWRVHSALPWALRSDLVDLNCGGAFRNIDLEEICCGP